MGGGRWHDWYHFFADSVQHFGSKVIYPSGAGAWLKVMGDFFSGGLLGALLTGGEATEAYAQKVFVSHSPDRIKMGIPCILPPPCVSVSKPVV